MEVRFTLRPLCLREESLPGTRVQKELGRPQELVRTLQRRENSCALVWHRTVVGERVGLSQLRQAASSQTFVVEARSDDVTESSRHYVTIRVT